MKSYQKVLGIICFSYFLFMIFIHFVGNWNNYKLIELDQLIEIDIETRDGSEKIINQNKFDVINTGDRLIVTIPIPKDNGLAYPALCFNTFSCVTKIWFQDQLLYSYGEDLKDRGKMIGTLYDSVILPKEAIGNYIIMECIATEEGSMSQITNLILMEAVDSSKYPVINNLINLAIFSGIFIISFFILVIILFFNKKDQMVGLTSCLCTITCVMSLYILTSQGLIHPLVNDFRLIANIEYISIFFMPTAFAGFFYYTYDHKILKKITGTMIVVHGVFFLITTILNYTTKSYHYVYFLPFLHLQIIIAAIIYCIVFFIPLGDKKKEQWITFVRSGIVILVVFSILEILRFNLAKLTNEGIFKMKLLPLGVILVITTFSMGVIMEVIKRFKEVEEKKQLEKLAYYDFLTGLETRARCYTLIEKIKKEHIWDFTIFFIDLNNLKYCNDVFGHEMGDNYIKTVAQIMKECFYDADTISRFGGDEFVVLYISNIEEKIENYTQIFYKKMEEVNKSNIYPFKINAACGVVSSTRENPLEIEAAIAIADKKMYENKTKIKQKIR